MPQTHVLDAENRVDLLKSGAGRDKLMEVIQSYRTARGESEKNRINYQRYFKKRFGVRPSITTWPWRNAANLHMPYIDKTIRRAKPKFIRLIESVNPVVTLKSNLIGDDMGFVRSIERKFDELLREKAQIVERVALGVDKMCERGYFLAKVVQEFTPTEVEEVMYMDRLPDSWNEFLSSEGADDNKLGFAIANRFEMDVNDPDDNEEIRSVIEQIRAGRSIVRFKRVVDQTEFPSLYIRDSTKVIVPYGTTDIRYSSLITDKVTTRIRDMEVKGQSNVWDQENTYKLIERIDANGRRDMVNYSGDNQQEYVDTLENIREGVYPSSSLPEVDEHYFYFRFPGDRISKPAVLTLNSENPDLPLRFIPYPYVDQFGAPDCWPFTQVMFEIVSERYHAARGIPQMLDSLQTEITNNHNAKQNHMTIATSLNIKAKKNSNISTQWIPGQPLWCNRMEDVDVLQIGSKDVSFDNEEKGLVAWGDSYMGLMDNPLTSGPSQEGRTEKEIEKISEIQDDVAYGDVVIFQLGMNKIYQQFWNRWMQYGPENIMVQKADGTMMKIEKEELRRRFRLQPTGNLGNSSIHKRARDARMRLQLFNNDQFINQHELRRQALVLDDERVAETLLLSPEEAQQSQVERQIQEIQMIGLGYTVIPKLSDDDKTHVSVIDDFMTDPAKMRSFPADRVPALMDHRQAHLLSSDRKQRSTTRGGRLQQEVGNVAQGITGRQARNSVPAESLRESK